MAKIKSSFDGKRITPASVRQYVEEIYGKVYQREGATIRLNPLLQNDYGGDLDCTLTSITTIVRYYRHDLDDKSVYKVVEDLALQYGYRGNKGTNPVVHRNIMKEAFLKFGLSHSIKHLYLNNIMFNFNKIKKIIDTKTPIMLNMQSDGRNFYGSHSVTIIGYQLFETVSGGKTIPMLKVYDNWSKLISYVDPIRMGLISSIVYPK